MIALILFCIWHLVLMFPDEPVKEPVKEPVSKVDSGEDGLSLIEVAVIDSFIE